MERVLVTAAPRRRYPYCDVVVGLAWSEDPKSYTGDSVATGRAPRTRQVKGDDPDKKEYPGPPGWGLGIRLKTSPPKKIYLLRGFLNLTLDRHTVSNIFVWKLLILETGQKQHRRHSMGKDL